MILVTGGTGFLGSELLRQLLEQGKPLRALKRRTSVIPEILSNDRSIDWRDGDVLDYYALKEAMQGVSQVYHCAAMVSFHQADKNQIFKVNVEGTANLVNICLENPDCKLIHASSISAIGQSKNGELSSESDHWQFSKSQSNYAISKYESEMEVFRGIAEGLNAVIVNPSIIIGKNAGKEGSGQLFETVRRGLQFYTGGTCGLVDVKDVAGIMIRLMESPINFGRYIINSENISYKELFTAIARAYGLKPPAIKLTPWMLRAGYMASLIAKAVTGKSSGITKEIISSAFKTSRYSNQKIKEAVDINFKPVGKTILEICQPEELNKRH